MYLYFGIIVYTVYVNVFVYTDGSCFSEPALGGWGVYIVYGKQKTIEFSGYSKCRSSITMELTAVSKSFEYINSFLYYLSPLHVVIYTDCDYIVKLYDKKSRADKIIFPIRDKISKRNKQILFDICNNAENFSSIEWVAVKSHSGIKGNEIADRLAKKAVRNFKKLTKN